MAKINVLVLQNFILSINVKVNENILRVWAKI